MIRNLTKLIAAVLVTATFAFAGQAILGGKRVKPIDKVTQKKISEEEQAKLDTIDLGAGCFWCIEAVLERVKGVKDVESGYMGGKTKDPTYKDITTGTTGHAEIVRVKFDSKELSFEKLLEVFWELHDPTTLNRQGADVGTQYRSAIFYHNEEQKKVAENSRAKKNKSGKFDSPIVTEITKASKFYPAEDYHQDFFDNNKTYGYCRAVIWPKLAKLGMLKEE
ncbi:MAG: peptide-methionine (S)-S-oxide reductase MsrA [Verrucomicrobiota bacterium]|nr:peptide-methionine (S)-S-oxide reductase MsrA [Verrucomicrobiota bacterium]MEE2966251.1 peptide-methionine (S)-S-oxide reductase MsrA [Verrucomicrobiota bacterium]HAA87999.1 peptide-methionine (S)-S-oxide reductase [Verrucomicrobiales bacterium]|tara:strand:+ start:392 stop:1057 length:666 start_codon:yes stop_codon:yes gene_type:complete